MYLYTYIVQYDKCKSIIGGGRREPLIGARTNKQYMTNITKLIRSTSERSNVICRGQSAKGK